MPPPDTEITAAEAQARLVQSYLTVFGPDSEAADRVLEDLVDFGGLYAVAPELDPQVLAYQAGKQRLVLRILSLAGRLGDAPRMARTAPPFTRSRSYHDGEDEDQG